MSSLRDQLLAKGLVSKKKARSVGRELKEDRKRKQGKRRRKKVVEAEERARLDAAREAEREAAVADRKRREAAKARTERALRVLQLLHGNRMKVNGKVRFHHPSADGRHLLRMSVSERAAFQLRNGDLGIAAVAGAGGPSYVVLPRAAVERLKELAPRVVVFHVVDVAGLSDPALAFVPSAAVGDLGARRATEADVARLAVTPRGAPREPEP